MKALLLGVLLMLGAGAWGLSLSPTAEVVDWSAVTKAALSTHRHNKLVHFPLALGVTGLFFLIACLRYESLRSAGRWMVFLAAVSSIAAVLTGRGQAEDVEGAALRQVLEGHEFIGTTAMFGLWLSWVLSLMDSATKWRWAVYLLVALGLLGAGFQGGILAHLQL